MLAFLLQHEGHTVAAAADGPAARLVAAAEFEPDVAILDIGMPGINGYEVAQRAAEAGSAAPVVLIALSGLGQEEDKRRAADAGFDHHFTKPVDIAVLMTVLNEVGNGGPSHVDAV